MKTKQSAERAELIERVCAYLQEIHPRTAGLHELGERFHISPFHLQRSFKAGAGITPRQFADNLRPAALQSAGPQGRAHNRRHSYRRLWIFQPTLRTQRSKPGYDAFYLQKGRRRHDDLFQRRQLPLGLAAGGGHRSRRLQGQPGRSARAPLIDDLSAEFANAERLRDDDGLGFWVEHIVAYLEGWQPDINLPLDLRATAFQLKVWRELQAIPVGETRSYSEIAAAIGQPSASRRRRGRLRQEPGRAGDPPATASSARTAAWAATAGALNASASCSLPKNATRRRPTETPPSASPLPCRRGVSPARRLSRFSCAKPVKL